MNSSLRSGMRALALAIVCLGGAQAATAQVPPWVAHPDGDLDPRFGGGGIVPTVGSVAVLQSDGKIVVAGIGRLARHNVDGSLDQTFGAGGIVATDGGRAIITQADDRLLALSGDSTLVRYNRDGSLDTSFGTGGRVITPGRAGSVALAPGGRIVVALENGPTRVVRYNPSGTLDPTFGSGGGIAFALPSAALVIQPDGKIVGVGDGFGPTSLRQDFMVVRLQANGSLDPSFGNNGTVYTDFGGRIDHGTAILRLQDGRIVAGGSIGTNRVSTPFDFGLARYLDDGSLDGTFGFGGVMTTTIRGPFYTSGITRMALHTDGKIVAAGSTTQPLVSLPDVALVRYNSNGTVDNAFGTAGVVTTDIGGTSDTASDVLLQGDGKIVVTAFASATADCECTSTYVLARYTHDSARGVFAAALRTIPAQIPARDYDLGGQGAGYFDSTAGNESGGFIYRTDDVDLKRVSGDEHAIGWFSAGEWLAYTIDVPRAGVYTVAAEVGSAVPGRTFHLALDGTDVTGPIVVPNLGAWDTYATVRRPLSLSAGRHVLRVVMGPVDFMEFRSLDITEGDAGESRSGNDFDGDGRTDLAVFRPVSGTWYVANGSTALGSFGWGLPGDRPLAGDFDRDGRTDLTVWRPSTGTWYIRESSSGYSEAGARVIQWGLPGDVPLVADFDGDGQSDLTVFRPSVGMWYVRSSSRGYAAASADAYQWGLPGDLPMAADFDGDGKSELTVFRPSVGTWYVRYSARAYATADAVAFQWGLPGDVPLSADFDGDGASELTVFRPTVGMWYVRYSSRGYAVGDAAALQWGLPGDVPISGDFDGDGRTDLTVYRAPTGQWYMRASSLEYDPARAAVFQWGLPGDIPVQ